MTHNLMAKDKNGNDVAAIIETGNDSNPAYIEYVENHIVKRTYIISPTANTFHQIIVVNLMHEWKDQAGNIILNNQPTSYKRDNKEEFQYFFNMQINGTWGDLINKHCLNGYIYEVFGIRCFDEMGNFYQHEYIDEPEAN